MGSFTWFDLTEVGASADEALQLLRAQRFEEFRQRCGPRGPRTLELLMRREDCESTASVFDLVGTGEREAVDGLDDWDDFEPGMAVPARPEDLLRAFGTQRPNVAQVLLRGLQYAELHDRWEATWFQVFDGAAPAGWCFAGCAPGPASDFKYAAALPQLPQATFRPRGPLAALIGAAPLEPAQAYRRAREAIEAAGHWDPKREVLAAQSVLGPGPWTEPGKGRWGLLKLHAFTLDHLELVAR